MYNLAVLLIYFLYSIRKRVLNCVKNHPRKSRVENYWSILLFVSLYRFFSKHLYAAISAQRVTLFARHRTALSAVVTDMKLMMHRDRSYIFRFLSDVTAPTLGRDRGITSILQQRHSGSIDLTPLHPISAVARITLVQEHTTETLNACTFTKYREYDELVSGFSLSPSFLKQANLRDTLRVIYICVCVCVYSSYQPRGWKGVECKKTERRSLCRSVLRRSSERRHSNRTSHHRWTLTTSQGKYNNDNIKFCKYCFKQFAASYIC